MDSFSIQTTPENFEKDTESLNTNSIQLLILFTSKDILKNSDICTKIRTKFPNARLIGCSTSGEIGEAVEDDSVALMGLGFKTTTPKVVSVPIEGVNSSRSAGKEFGGMLAADDLKGIFVLLPGLSVNGSQFTIGMKDVIPKGISISGGMAGDGLDFHDTLTVLDDELLESHAVGFGLYGENISMASCSKGGWKPFGPLRRVTRCENNVLYELDGKPALDLYKEYLGEKADELPASGLLYPFAIMDEMEDDMSGLIRTILDIDEENKSLILAGDMEKGQTVCLMHANTDELVSGAQGAAEQLIAQAKEARQSALICVSCVGRKIVMGDDTEDELDVIRDVLGDDKSIAGFYSYGEISHSQDTDDPEFHNQTMTITHIAEKVA